MTNDAISTILEYLFQEARSSAEAVLRAAELLRGGKVDEDQRAQFTLGSASADRLLRAIGDVRSLLSRDAAPVVMDKFDLARCAFEIVEVLNMASPRGARPMVMEGTHEGLPITQDRRAVEELLTRVLDTAGKLGAGDVHLRLKIAAGGTCARAAISVGEADLAARLANWLNTDADHIQFAHPGDVPFAVGLMSAGRRLRAFGGAAELTRDSSGFFAISLDVPLHAAGAEDAGAYLDPGPAAHPDALAVLVAEDNDESFVLTEVELQDERIWRALDGPQALRMIQNQRFDVVFMDVHMPGMDGYQVIRSMREWETQTGNARTPLVVLSSDDLETQRRSAAECGCSGFLSKPLRRWDVAPLLDRLKQTRMQID
jgi:CheY-like chemotaxis protein